MTIRIHQKQIGNGNPCYIIAEAGVNHNGDIALAKRLIDVAWDAGADAVKFQTFIAEEVISKNTQKADYQKISTSSEESQLAMVKKMELSFSEFRELKTYCDNKGITFLSTPFDHQSIDFLETLDIPAFKIPSGEITNFPYLEQIGKKKRPVILSTGMSTLDEIRQAVTVLRQNEASDIVLLHCTTEYPAPVDSINLRAMRTIHEAFHLPVGYSDHSEGITIALAAAAMGACIIEKHFTLDKSLPGPDHKASLDPDEMKNLVKGIRDIEAAFGTGIKEPTPTEEKNIVAIRKSIVARKDISCNQVIDMESVTAKRPGTGISPAQMSKVIGSRAKRAIKRDAVLFWEDIIFKNDPDGRQES